MRYELADHEWVVIKAMLPNKPRGVPRVNDRRVLNGIFWILRSGAPWRDLPDHFGPYTTCYNRFVRWRRAGVWGRIIDAFAAAHDAAVQMIDTSIVRVHQHGACITRNQRQSMGRSRGYGCALMSPRPNSAGSTADAKVSLRPSILALIHKFSTDHLSLIQTAVRPGQGRLWNGNIMPKNGNLIAFHSRRLI